MQCVEQKYHTSYDSSAGKLFPSGSVSVEQITPRNCSITGTQASVI